MKITPVSYNYTNQKNNNSQPAFGAIMPDISNVFKYLGERGKIAEASAFSKQVAQPQVIEAIDKIKFNGENVRILCKRIEDHDAFMIQATRPQNLPGTGKSVFKFDLTEKGHPVKDFIKAIKEATEDIANSESYKEANPPKPKQGFANLISNIFQ